MRTISVAVSKADYEAFRQEARAQNRPVAQLIREAMSFFREHKLTQRSRMTAIPVLPGHRLVGGLPDRSELWDDITAFPAGGRR